MTDVIAIRNLITIQLDKLKETATYLGPEDTLALSLDIAAMSDEYSTKVERYKDLE